MSSTTNERSLGRREIVIKLHNCATNDPCGICGQRTDPNAGPQFWLTEPRERVCDRCARKHAPELAEMYAAWWQRQTAGEATF